MGGVFRLLQDAPVEMEPGQLAVDEAIRNIGDRRPRGRRDGARRASCERESARNSTVETMACARSFMEYYLPFQALSRPVMTALWPLLHNKRVRRTCGRAVRG